MTLPVPGAKLYLCKSPDIAAMIHRRASSLSFAHVVELQVGPACGITAAQWRALNPTDDPGKPVSMATHRGHHANMRPDRIRDMHERAFEVIAGRLNDDDLLRGKRLRVETRVWLREVTTRAAASAMYGRENPIAWDPSLIEDLKWVHRLSCATVEPLLLCFIFCCLPP